MRTMIRAAFAALLLAASHLALALEVQPYSAEALAQAQGAGKAVAVWFHADWCPTCRQQEQALTLLQAEPGLDITVLKADYDKERELKRALKVRTQSTLIVYRGATEKARAAGDTDADSLRKALKTAL